MKDEEDYFLLSRKDVEERFGVCKRYLEIVDAKGLGPRRVLLGRSVRYRIKDVREWIDRQLANSEHDMEPGALK